MPHASADHTAGVEMQRQVWTSVSALFPSLDSILFPTQRFSHHLFRSLAIRPCGGRRYVSLPLQPFPQLCIGTPHMFVQGVPATLLVAFQIVTPRQRLAVARMSTGIV